MKWCWNIEAFVIVVLSFLECSGVVHAQSPPVPTPMLDALPLPEKPVPRWTIEDDVRQLRSQAAMQTALIRKLSVLVEDLLGRVESLEKSQLPRQVKRADQSQAATPRRRYVAPRPSRDEDENLPGYWETISP